MKISNEVLAELYALEKKVLEMQKCIGEIKKIKKLMNAGTKQHPPRVHKKQPTN